MNYGPLEVVEIVFPGNKFKGEVIPALKELVALQTIRILDLAVVHKDEIGNVRVLEIADLDSDCSLALLEIVDADEGLFSDEDFMVFGAGLEANSTAALMIFENTWAARLMTAVRNASGEVVLNERIPRTVADNLIAIAS